MKPVSSIAALALGLLLMSTRQAHAYLDPGLGSLLLQGLIAGIAGASFAASRYWQKLKALVSSFRRAPSATEPPPGPNRS
jgi:hypothetical protein